MTRKELTLDLDKIKMYPRSAPGNPHECRAIENFEPGARANALATPMRHKYLSLEPDCLNLGGTGGAEVIRMYQTTMQMWTDSRYESRNVILALMLDLTATYHRGRFILFVDESGVWVPYDLTRYTPPSVVESITRLGNPTAQITDGPVLDGFPIEQTHYQFIIEEAEYYWRNRYQGTRDSRFAEYWTPQFNNVLAISQGMQLWQARANIHESFVTGNRDYAIPLLLFQCNRTLFNGTISNGRGVFNDDANVQNHNLYLTPEYPDWKFLFAHDPNDIPLYSAELFTYDWSTMPTLPRGHYIYTLDPVWDGANEGEPAQTLPYQNAIVNGVATCDGFPWIQIRWYTHNAAELVTNDLIFHPRLTGFILNRSFKRLIDESTIDATSKFPNATDHPPRMVGYIDLNCTQGLFGTEPEGLNPTSPFIPNPKVLSFYTGPARFRSNDAGVYWFELPSDKASSDRYLQEFNSASLALIPSEYRYLVNQLQQKISPNGFRWGTFSSSDADSRALYFYIDYDKDGIAVCQRELIYRRGIVWYNTAGTEATPPNGDYPVLFFNFLADPGLTDGDLYMIRVGIGWSNRNEPGASGYSIDIPDHIFEFPDKEDAPRAGDMALYQPNYTGSVSIAQQRFCWGTFEQEQVWSRRLRFTKANGRIGTYETCIWKGTLDVSGNDLSDPIVNVLPLTIDTFSGVQAVVLIVGKQTSRLMYVINGVPDIQPQILPFQAAGADAVMVYEQIAYAMGLDGVVRSYDRTNGMQEIGLDILPYIRARFAPGCLSLQMCQLAMQRTVSGDLALVVNLNDKGTRSNTEIVDNDAVIHDVCAIMDYVGTPPPNTVTIDSPPTPAPIPQSPVDGALGRGSCLRLGTRNVQYIYYPANKEWFLRCFYVNAGSGNMNDQFVVKAPATGMNGKPLWGVTYWSGGGVATTQLVELENDGELAYYTDQLRKTRASPGLGATAVQGYLELGSIDDGDSNLWKIINHLKLRYSPSSNTPATTIVLLDDIASVVKEYIITAGGDTNPLVQTCFDFQSGIVTICFKQADATKPTELWKYLIGYTGDQELSMNK